MKKLLVAVLWAILASPSPILSQTPVKPIINSTLSGRVTDRTTKEPVPGAAVKIKGTTHGVSADEHGNFNFVTGQKFPYILIISSVGYQPVELTVNGGHVEIPLTPAQTQLSDVVVVGYGTQRKATSPVPWHRCRRRRSGARSALSKECCRARWPACRSRRAPGSRAVP